MYAAGAWAACVPFLPQYLNSKAILRCRLPYFHWNRAPSHEQSVHYFIILVSKTSRVIKNPYTFFAKGIYLRWLGCSPNWASLACLLTQIPVAARRFLTAGRAGPPESLVLQPRRGEEGSEARPQANQLPPLWTSSKWAPCRLGVIRPRGSATLCEGVSSWLSLP